MKTYVAKPREIEREWFVIDAAGKPLGRVATRAAAILRGKHKPTFTPNVDTGDHVVIINAEKAVLTGNKADEPIYRHSGYPGGLKSTTKGKVMAAHPEQLMMRAVKGMLPHNKLGAQMIQKLKVYAGAEHPHAAQMPKPLEWEG
ncbi:MAG TPA: 50S ribosomal protein L13 [Armatimonadetes bacterium]|jgi:large subunit ribosomal protein L13|nr:50S ribosomal protein L13 [Armatimonadota bacterium]